MTFDELLCLRPEGLYCRAGGFFVDPVRPVDRAVITHGHADHARAGHAHVLATGETLAIMSARYGADFAAQTQAAAYGETMQVGDVRLKLAPAGHVLGSAQVVIEAGGMRAVVSGDYKRRPDPTCPPFEPVPCDLFVTEATFALPVFRHPDPAREIEKLLKSVRAFPDRTHIVGAYALGKAQRVIALLRQAGYDEEILLHGAMEALCALYQRFGVELGPLTLVRDAPGKAPGRIVVAPPSAAQDRWSRRFADPLDCFASGWMRVRQRAKQRGVELPLIISDHADWDELTATILEVAPQEVWITHGRDEALLRWTQLNGLKGRPLEMVAYEDEDD